MIRVQIFCLCFLTGTCVFGQEEILTVQSKDFVFNNPENRVSMTTIDKDDNIVFVFPEYGALSLTIKRVDEEQRNLKIERFISDNFIYAITDNGSAYDIYYSTTEKEVFSLNKLIINKSDLTYTDEKEVFISKNKILSVFEEGDIYILAYNEHNVILDQINIVTGEVKKTVFDIPFEKFQDRFKKNRFTSYVPKQNHPTNYQASGLNKIYLKDNKLLMTFDDFGGSYTSSDDNYGNQTEIVELDLTNAEGKYYLLNGEEGLKTGKNNSFIYDDYLLRIAINSKNLICGIYDLESKSLLKKYGLNKMDKTDSINSGIYTYFQGKKNRTVRLSNYKSEPKKIVFWLKYGVPTIFASYCDGGISISSGRYYDENGAGVLTGPSLASWIAFAVVTAAKQAGNGPGVGTYINSYMDINLNILHSPKTSFRDRIDQYQADLTTKLYNEKVLHKSYTPVEDGLIFTYYNRKTKSFKLISFEK